MILRTLVDLYDCLVEKGELDKPGWQAVSVSWALRLDETGELKQVIPMLVSVQRGKKEMLVPQSMNVPEQAKRTVKPIPNFLCDNATYFLGVDSKGKPERARVCFEAAKALHADLLKDVDHPAARAIIAYFEKWDPSKAETNPAVAPVLEELRKGGNIIFMLGADKAQEIEPIRVAWDVHAASETGAVSMRCLVTGEYGPVARLHPAIKGIPGAQATGASLVSFNARAFDSFGRDEGQGLNAPVSTRAAFAYGAALNWLVKSGNNRTMMGDSTVLFWSDDAEPAYADCFSAILGEDKTITDDDLKKIISRLANGQQGDWEDVPLEPDNRFCILGLAPNAGRLSVRFFLRDTFGSFARHLEAHYRRMEIERPAFAAGESIAIYWLLNETVNQNSRDKKPSPQLAGDLARAILADSMYPATLFEQLEVRIRAEHNITWRKAAIIKAYFLKNTTGEEHDRKIKEVLTVQLNEQTTYPPYVMGRIFAVLEGLQQAANPGINTTIRDRYFNSACATPGSVFPTLIRLAQAHLKKLDGGLSHYYNSQLGDLLSRMTEPYPARMSLQDQGVFQLGYYHQTQKRYQKKEEK